MWLSQKQLHAVLAAFWPSNYWKWIRPLGRLIAPVSVAQQSAVRINDKKGNSTPRFPSPAYSVSQSTNDVRPRW